MSKSTSFLYQLARTANDIEKLASEIGLYVASADVSVSCGFKFDEWKTFVQGINKADEEFKRIIYDPKIKLVFSPLVYTPKEVKGRISLGDDFVRDILEKGEVLYVR